MISQFSGSGMAPLIAAVTSFEKELWLKRRRIVRILAVDPGVVTGVCVLWIDADTGEIVGWAETLITHAEQGQVWHLIELLRVLANFGRVWIAIEDFRVQMVNMDSAFLSPVRIGHRFAFGAEMMQQGLLGDPLFGSIEDIAWQGNGRKADYSDERLKKLGFYTPGPDHRRDATRHALVRWKKLKTELPAGVETRAEWWEPSMTKLETTKGFGRNFNGVATGSHGQPAPKKVTKEDLARMALSAGRIATAENQEVSDEMKAMAETNGMKWVPMPNGVAGWVLEHDPATQSGIAPRSGPKKLTETEIKEIEGSFPPLAVVLKKRRRVVKKLV